MLNIYKNQNKKPHAVSTITEYKKTHFNVFQSNVGAKQ